MRFRLSHRLAPGWWGGVAFGGLRSLQGINSRPRQTTNRPGEEVFYSIAGLGCLALFVVALVAVFWLPILVFTVSFVAIRTAYLLLTDPTTRWWDKTSTLARQFVIKTQQNRHIRVHSALYEAGTAV